MNKLSILIIDDSKLINDSLCSSLEERGFDVTQAYDISTAKETILNHSFDYALLDLVLPDGDGEELLPFLQIHEEIRVIVMTSDRDADRRKNLFNFGIVIDYITKERHFNEMELSIVQLIERISTNDGLNILVVDDSHFMRTTLRILLSKRGFKVFTAVDGKEALEVIKERKIDAAIVDLEMPVMDGNRLLSAIRRNKSNLLMPIMIVSGTNDPQKIAHVIKNGANDFIKKPYVNEELLLKIDKMMQELKQQRLIKVHEATFAMYNKAIDEAAILFKLDSNLNITYANTYLSDLLHNSDEITVGTNFKDYVADGDKIYLDPLRDKLAKGYPQQISFRFNTPDAKLISLKLTFTPIKHNEEYSEEILVIGFDISLLQQNEDLLQARINKEVKKNWEQNKLLIQQSKMASMGEMIGHIGHQWRQPLNSLGLLFQKLNKAYQKEKLTDELMKNSAEKAMYIMNQMSETINDFKDFFKDDKSVQLCDLTSVVEHASSLVEPSIEANKIKLVINSTHDISILCLKNELSQVILNILTNAMDALIQNNVENPEILLSIDKIDNDATIIIEDNAGGIADNIIEKIFEPYFTTKENENGTGIGLYMSQTIIQKHMNGQIKVNNTVSGASFKIVLPINSKETHE